ncbi:ABC transporter ATP-binding protein [Alicyclobacillus sp. SO9]|uniref:ABC transporter ATP-binding protein n=1 Tax=Alicyclobacillus sp. SO9 TaxID=2665646 RepID=UPI0018E7679F|nr:oligopeptide/dipeptide ABC transporter ATP-binding protein [Alicyclobacillus sp. SO9]QQE80173.1 ATP-binding cassette domain-containing protein [Alicyclobacillus sp. SO9]
MALLQLRNIKKHFAKRKQVVRAVDGIDIEIPEGKTFGLVGESGCGKSTTGRLILGLNSPTGGEIYYRQQNIHKMSRDASKKYRRQVQMVFQDPYASLDPRMKVEDIIAEGMQIHGLADGTERRNRVVELVERVGLKRDDLSRFPHEFSGGQRQRIGIARALAVNPELVIADEPISALDVSIQAQVMSLLKSLQSDFGLTYLFISHDLTMVQFISDRIGVMYLGKIVEHGDSKEVYQNPQHPYTKALLSAIPSIGESTARIQLTGDIPSPAAIPQGCRFHTRCPFAVARCKNEEPVLKGGDTHQVACFLVED